MRKYYQRSVYNEYDRNHHKDQKNEEAPGKGRRAERRDHRDPGRAESYDDRTGIDELKAGEYKIRYALVTSNRFDSTAFKKLYGDLYRQFLKTGTSRRFTVA